VAYIVRLSIINENNRGQAIAVESGIDDNDNGILNPAEVYTIQKVFNGAAGTVALISITNETVGPNFAYGGKKIESGLDLDDDSILDPGEAATPSYLCNGIDGINWIDGTNGVDGADGAGETCLIYGSSTLSGTKGLASANATFTGEAAGNNSGYCISSTGDVNGDGFGDILVGAYWADPVNKSAAGETYLFTGSGY